MYEFSKVHIHFGELTSQNVDIALDIFELNKQVVLVKLLKTGNILQQVWLTKGKHLDFFSNR